MPALVTSDDTTRCSTFSAPGGCDESFITIATTPGASFIEALDELGKKYARAVEDLGLADGTALFCRLFLSDILNQKAALLQSALHRRLRGSCALSIIEQKPIGGGPLSLLSYHVRSPRHSLRKQLSHSGGDGWASELVVDGRHYRVLLTANHTGGEGSDAHAQTRTVFDALSSVLERKGMTLLGNGIRTWVYVRDPDRHYPDMVRARRECFAERGLTDATRYLASTGILGITHSPRQIVSVDSWSVGGLAPAQIQRMEARSHLGPTSDYGVTFERGLRVRFGDRSHLHISGTASIDNRGDVLHEGDAAAQTRRTIDNVRALLQGQGASLDDLAYVIAYVRNAHDQRAVRGVLDEELGGRLPLVFTEAAVCRPAWLVELEGAAILRDETEFPPFL
jgi:enamine deaminase RidA (YjgF/YER057c/UK114 family)